MKLLILAIGFGTAMFIILSFMHGGTSKPTPTPPRRIEPIGRRRYDKLWVVDREDNDDAE